MFPIKEILLMVKKQIEDLAKLGEWIRSQPDELSLAKLQSERDNPWFTSKELDRALNAISTHFLSAENLNAWMSRYAVKVQERKNVGLIMAGNLPLVGFHDWLSVFLSGHIAHVKLSSKDAFLLPALLQYLHKLNPIWSDRTVITDRLTELDAIIATGSNNSNRYFSHYFGHLPHIFRSHRNGIAVITPDVTKEELELLGEDVFAYFGLGCRSVSLCMIPEGFDEERLFLAWTKYREIRHHSKWDNNFRYNYSTLLLNQEQFLTDDVIILRQAGELSSRIACLHLLPYQSVEECANFIRERKDQIQVVVGRSDFDGLSTVGFGESQQPGLEDYADHVDTMRFLTDL